jgi:hypothetical protein
VPVVVAHIFDDVARPALSSVRRLPFIVTAVNALVP